MSQPVNMSFNTQVMRIVAILYENHPIAMTIELNDLLGLSKGSTWSQQDEQFALGTMKWVYENGFINANYLRDIGELEGAQLTAHMYGLLCQNHTNLITQPLGQATVVALQQGQREIDAVGSILMDKLTGN